MIKFNVSKTYDVVSQESAKNGDVEESGFVFESTEMTLREVISELDNLGFYENFQPDALSQSLYCVDRDIDSYTGDETSEALHIDATPRAMRRLNKILSK